MLRQRLIAAVIVRGGRAVQSFGFKRWLPLGEVGCVIQNLDRWGADGIVVLCIDRNKNGPDLELLQNLSKLDISTPLSYGGGIRNANDAQQAVQAGAERLILDRALSEASDQLPVIAAAVGQQALIASVPMFKTTEGLAAHWKHWSRTEETLKDWLATNKWMDYVSEILAIDINAEGTCLGPDLTIIQELIHLELPILVFGGISTSEQVAKILQSPGISAAVIGNALNYQEQSIRKLKDNLKALPLRTYQSTSLLPNSRLK